MNSFFLCLAFNFSIIKQEVFIYKDSLKTLCNSAEYLIQESKQNKIDPFVMTALIYYESAWQHNISGPTGDCGLTQILHKYVKDTSCKDLYQPNLAIYHGIRVLRTYKTYLENKNRPSAISDALKCYPSGYKCECTRCDAYSKKIMRLANKLKKEYKKIRKYSDETTR